MTSLLFVTAFAGRAWSAPPEPHHTQIIASPEDIATFQTFDIEEVFSNADGSVQFIELRESAGADGLNHFAGNQLTSNGNVYIFPNDLPSEETANKSVIIATAAFAALPGAVTPDFIIPERFFEVTGDTISLIEVGTNEVVYTFVFGGPPQTPCPCDADVDNNGHVDVIDGACIADCKDNGNCSCCLSSCDVNCDGVVDTGDIGDDVVNDPSVWLCLFQGGTTEVCCAAPPPTGACCDTTTGTCNDSVLEADCSGQNEAWSESLACSQVNCQPAPTGACCNLGNGQCQDDVLSANCSGANFEWTQGMFCSTVSCRVPPQIPCPCDADVDDNGRVDAIDGACIADCKDNGNCSCCLSSCDVNCDGVVDVGDIGDDVINDPSAWLCLFQGGMTETCCTAPSPTFLSMSAGGACCNVGIGQCQDGLAESECMGTGLIWTSSTTCSEVSCMDTLLPTDGTHSLYSDGTIGTNSPTNFSGESGSISAVPEIPTTSPESLVFFMLLIVTATVAIMRIRMRGDCPPT